MLVGLFGFSRGQAGAKCYGNIEDCLVVVSNGTMYTVRGVVEYMCIIFS